MTTSPFPGMDPYLERHWPSVHVQLIAATTRQLNRHLPPGLVARPEQQDAVEIGERFTGDDPAVVRRYRPDVRVSRRPGTSAGGAGGLAVALAARTRWSPTSTRSRNETSASSRWPTAGS